MADLHVDQVTKDYPTRSLPLCVLRGCSLGMMRGERLAIVGPSGSGKSTLLQIVGTLDTPTTGRVTLDGVDPTGLDEPALARFRNERIGFVFQDHHLLPQCSVLENVLIPTLARGGATPADVDRAEALIERVGLSSRVDHRPAELSGGERQRVAIARALVLRPVLVLADEPTGNLDHTNAAAIGELLVALPAQESLMLLVVTHSSELAARFPKVLAMDDGRLVERPTAAGVGT